MNKRQLEISQIMVDALRTIASRKKDYGETINDIVELSDIARHALIKIGCFK